MRYITVPNPVSIVDPVQHQPILDEHQKPKRITFVEFVRGLLGDRRFMTNYKMMRRAQKIDDDITAKKPGEVVEIEDADYEVLKRVFEEPEGGYMGPARQCFSFIEAVVNASDKHPLANGKLDKVEAGKGEAGKTEDVASP